MDNLSIVLTMLYLLDERRGFDAWWFNIDRNVRKHMIKDFVYSLDSGVVIKGSSALEYLLSEDVLEEGEEV